MADNVSGGLDFGALQKLPLSVKLCEKNSKRDPECAV